MLRVHDLTVEEISDLIDWAETRGWTRPIQFPCVVCHGPTVKPHSFSAARICPPPCDTLQPTQMKLVLGYGDHLGIDRKRVTEYEDPALG